MNRIEAERKLDGVTVTQTIVDPDAKPSWKRSGTGRAILDLRGCHRLPTNGGPWLQMVTTECGEHSARAAFFTLDRAGLEAMRAMCEYLLREPGA